MAPNQNIHRKVMCRRILTRLSQYAGYTFDLDSSVENINLVSGGSVGDGDPIDDITSIDSSAIVFDQSTAADRQAIDLNIIDSQFTVLRADASTDHSDYAGNINASDSAGLWAFVFRYEGGDQLWFSMDDNSSDHYLYFSSFSGKPYIGFFKGPVSVEQSFQGESTMSTGNDYIFLCYKKNDEIKMRLNGIQLTVIRPSGSVSQADIWHNYPTGLSHSRLGEVTGFFYRDDCTRRMYYSGEPSEKTIRGIERDLNKTYNVY